MDLIKLQLPYLKCKHAAKENGLQNFLADDRV